MESVDKTEIKKDIESTSVVIDNIIIDRFDELFSNCSSEHLQMCNCQNDIVEVKFKEYMDKEWAELDENDDLKKEKLVEERLDYCKRKSIKEVALQCKINKTRCPLEKKEIEQNISMFSNKFSLDDPRVYMVVKSVLSHQLSVFRMQQQSNYRGILHERYDKDGNAFLVINPVEAEKRKFDDSIIKAVEILNRIVYGDKSTVKNYNVDVTQAILDAYKPEGNDKNDMQ